jgi:hypothetical protein
MEADDHRAAAGLNPVGERRGEKLLEVFQLVVDGNSQGLKDPCARMDIVAPLRTARHRGGDGGDEVGRRPLGVVRTT